MRGLKMISSRWEGKPLVIRNLICSLISRPIILPSSHPIPLPLLLLFLAIPTIPSGVRGDERVLLGRTIRSYHSPSQTHHEPEIMWEMFDSLMPSPFFSPVPLLRFRFFHSALSFPFFPSPHPEIVVKLVLFRNFLGIILIWVEKIGREDNVSRHC